MDIDFSKYIIQQKERDTLYKPFPSGEGFALFAKTEGGEFMKILFSSKETLESFLKALGFDWGVEKGEFLNFDSISRILKRYPELEKAEDAVASEEGKGIPYVYKISYRGRNWEIEGLKSLQDMSNHPGAVELKEVDHPPRYSVANENVPKKKDGSPKKKMKKRECEKGEYRDKNGDLKKTKAKSYAELWKKVNEPLTTTSKKKLPPWMDKDKKEDKKEDKKGDKKEKGKDGKKMPPWLKKKKSKATYSELHRKVNETSEEKED